MKQLFFLAFLLANSTLYAQTPVKVRGTVRTSDNKTLSGASVMLTYAGSQDTLKTVSNEKGNFTLNNVKAAKVQIIISYIGYKKFINEYDYREAAGEQQVWDIVMSPGDYTLETVTVESAKIQIKEDTVSYVVDSTMYRKNDNVEQVLKKLPGVEVDKNGKVTAQGTEVTKVKVNGKDFFAGDITTATRELNADMVDKIQIIDDYGDQSAFTGVRDGEANKTLNIQLKKDKNKGYFGNISGGAGTEERYQAGVSVNYFNNDQQISLIGNMNNSNASTFNFGSMGPIAASMGLGRGGAGVGALFGNLNNAEGLSDTKSLGINIRDKWGSKVSAYGSYSISHKNTVTSSTVSQQNLLGSGTNTNTQNNLSRSQNSNHRFSFNVEYRIDSFNYIKFTPTINYRRSGSNSNSDFEFFRALGTKSSDGFGRYISVSDAPNISGNILFNHRFKKRGRTLSLNLSAGSSEANSEDYSDNYTTYYDLQGNPQDSVLNQYIRQNNNNHNYGFRASYIEPLSKTKSLEFNYSYNNQVTGNKRENFVEDVNTGELGYADSLSSVYENTYVTNRVGVNFRNNQKKFNYSIGMALQPASIETNNISGKFQYAQDIVNYFPTIRYSYNFSRSRSFSINYNGSTNQPSYTQLQPVTDYSNPQYLVTGNPNLRPEFSNSLSLRYNNFDFISGNVFFGSISGTYTNDKIVSNVFSKGLGIQETRYANADGYYSISGFYNISRPYQNRKYVFNYGGNVNYIHNLSFLADVKNEGRNWIVGQRLSFDYKLKKWLETNIAGNFRVNSNEYSLRKTANASTTAWTISHSSRIFLPKNFILTSDMDKTINDGYTGTILANPFIINAALEKQFLKSNQLSLKLQAFDLLNENISVSRSVTGTNIIDTRANKLGRYFMLSFVLRLNKFTGQAPQRTMMAAPGGGPGMHILRN